MSWQKPDLEVVMYHLELPLGLLEIVSAIWC
jgi:hypothetical protein